MTVYFSFLFHIYQPPTQIPPVIKQVVKESYLPVIEALKNHPVAKITLNINGTLTEQLMDFGYDGLINDIAGLASKGQIEFTGSAKYHPLLALIPEPEIIRQIELNNETNKRYFGNAYRPRGFFPPEMAISEEVLNSVKQQGFEWIIASGIANVLPEFPTSFVSQHPNGLKLLFRDDYISVDCAFDKVNNVDAFVSRIYYKHTSEDYYVLLAMDGETFGHHVKHAIKNFLIPLFQALSYRQDIKMCTISEIVDRFPLRETQQPRDSSWSTMPYDLANDVPFPLWFNPSNPIHVEQYRFLMYGLTLIHLASKFREEESSDKRAMFDSARNLFDRGLHSCASWWASKRPWYSPDMILRGLNEVLMSSVNAKRSIPESAPEIKEAFDLIMDAMLKAHNQIVLNL